MTATILLAALAWHWTPPTPDLPPGLVSGFVFVVAKVAGRWLR